jgi:hypothetical protein
LTSLSCLLADGTTATGTVASPGITAITVEAGKTTTCTFANTKRPKIIVKKVTSGSAGGPFGFTTTGGNGLDAAFNLTTTGTGDAGSDSKTFEIAAAGVGGTYTVTEGTLPAGWILTDLGCSVNGGGVAPGDAGTKTVTITNLAAGSVVTCTFVNSGALTTRTQGFWSTHMWLVAKVWTPTGYLIDAYQTDGMTAAERSLCGGPLNVSQVMGGFWSNIAQKTTGTPKKRSNLDQARMRLAQQLLAAILNNQVFGSAPSGSVSLAQARAAFCGTDIAAINAAHSAMAAFNESGDSGAFTPGASADAKAARADADIAFWNTLPV